MVRLGVLRYARTALYVALATAAAWSARSLLALEDLVAVYLLVIMIVAVRHGRGPAVAAAGLSVVAYDVFFIAPHYTFYVADQRHLLTFAIMFAVGLVISQLALLGKAAALRAETEEIRSSLLSAVSHDLRTPLAAITGAGTALRGDDAALAPAERAELIDTIVEEAERLERLVANLLDMTRVQSGTLVVKREWVPVDELVGSALARVEARLEGRVVTTDVPPLPLVAVDPTLFEHAFVNLLENALKHTPRGTPIDIAARRAGDTVEIEVADRGPGLPAGAPEALFEKFARGAPATTPGVGLGLPISRGIARAHGGDVVAQRRAGGGASFLVTLPVAAGAPEVAET
ncbi:MAG TPA: DUF4118 domain-containing protein [Kofleriaceae bacterium]|nr:DUF4118 domain-containing protein [Kofleriaceae bacterium]